MTEKLNRFGEKLTEIPAIEVCSDCSGHLEDGDKFFVCSNCFDNHYRRVYNCELRDMYDDMLNDCYETVEICGYKYDPARALKCTDEVAYTCGFNDWLDSELKEGLIFELNDEYYIKDLKL